MRGASRYPFVRFAVERSDSRLVQNAVVHHSVPYLDEVASHATRFLAQVVHGISSFLQRLEEAIGSCLYVFLGVVSELAQRVGITSEKSLLRQLLVQLLRVCLIEFLEYVLSEFLDVSDDVPVVFFVDVLLDEVHYPFQKVVLLAQFGYELVHGVRFDVLVVQLHLEVGCQVQLSCEIAQHALKERVDGLYSEVAVVAYDVVKGYAGSLRKHLVAYAQLFLYFVRISLRVWQLFPDAV